MVTGTLLFRAQNSLFRFRQCFASVRCLVLRENAKRTTHSAACRHALSYSNLSEAEKKARKRYAKMKMRERRNALKALREGEIRRARRRER